MLSQQLQNGSICGIGYLFTDRGKRTILWLTTFLHSHVFIFHTQITLGRNMSDGSYLSQLHLKRERLFNFSTESPTVCWNTKALIKKVVWCNYENCQINVNLWLYKHLICPENCVLIESALTDKEHSLNLPFMRKILH